MWNQVNSPYDVPADREVRLAVIAADKTVHALVFPCRRIGNSWIDSKLRRSVDIFPTHWQGWTEDKS
jgi:hypothetical protein